MQTEAIFKHIQESITQEINLAQHSIYVVVAWFTDIELFSALADKAKQGCNVNIITSNDLINQNSKIKYEQFSSENFKIHLYGNSEKDLIHHKFCVIDKDTVITGSYNWTNKAKINSENIVITRGNEVLVNQFIEEFYDILRKAGYKTVNFKQDLDNIIKRLEIIKNLILIEDTDMIHSVINKLGIYNNEELNNIAKAIKNNSYSKAIKLADDFINTYRNDKVTIWKDSELHALKLELKTLEIQLNAYVNEKIELEKELIDFQYRHTKEVGALISEILKYRKFKYRNDKKKFKEAKKDEEDYNAQYEENKKIKKFDLTVEEKKELKTKFRKASILCHPDKVNDKMKEEAEKVFIDLKNAYDNNDIITVNEILNSLEKGKVFKSKSDTVTEKDKIKLAVEKIKGEIKITLESISEIKESETYSKISEIEDYDEYFNDLKIQLKEELKNLRILNEDNS